MKKDMGMMPTHFTICLVACLVAVGVLGCSGEAPAEARDTDTGWDTQTDTATQDDTQTQDTGPDTETEQDTDTETDTGEPVAVNFTILTYNVGNPDAEDLLYPLRMSSQEYEEHMAGVIQEMSPDVVFLQEVLSAKTCEAFTETDPAKTCYQWDTRPRPARRLLGDDYTIVCDARDQVECVGVHMGFGEIEGLEPGAYLDGGAITPALPLAECVWADGECTDDYCDAESTVSAITALTDAGPLRIVHMHPMAQVSATVSGDPCRADQLRQVLEGGVIGLEDALVEGFDRALIAGDWNLGLEVYWARTLFGEAQAADVWYENIDCDTCGFSDLDPRDWLGSRYSTTSSAPAFIDDLGMPIAIDHVVVSEGIDGTCVIHDEGGQSGTERLDEAFPGLASLGANERIDHYAISCELTVEPSL